MYGSKLKNNIMAHTTPKKREEKETAGNKYALRGDTQNRVDPIFDISYF